MIVDMDKDYEDLNLTLNSLLKDICNFLETNTLHMSPAEKKNADSLIERSKTYLQNIEKFNTGKHSKICDIPTKQLQEAVEINNSNANDRYVDMTKKPVPPQRNAIIEPLYESTCPFKDLPAKEASQEIKCGTLSKRKRVLNIIDVSTKVYAAVHENWLLLYNSSKDLKPDCALDLKLYEAKEDETDQNLNQLDINRDELLKKNNLSFKMSSSFKVIHSSAEKKSYNFVATTHKDMLQWVVNINRRHDKAVSAVKQIHDEQNYEICQDLQELETEENIYHEIEMPCQSRECRPDNLKSSEIDDRPAIPEKRPIVPQNISRPLSLSKSTESMDCYEELEDKVPEQNTSNKTPLSSFETSDEEEDQTYYELGTVIKDKVLPLPVMSTETVQSLHGHKKLALQTTQLLKKESEPENADDKSSLSEHELLKHRTQQCDTTVKPRLPDKNLPKPLTPKPKILSPKPWKPFRKSLSSKNLKSPELSKNKQSIEGPKSPLKIENKSSLKEFSCKDFPLTKENFESSSTNDTSNTPNDVCSIKPHQGSSIVRIIRNQWSTTQRPSSCSLETFSRNSKIETFQASPIKEQPPTDFLRTPTQDLNDSLRPIDSLIPNLTRNGGNEDQKPMVLLKSSVEDEDSSKILKKSPVVPIKPKKAAKKLPL